VAAQKRLKPIDFGSHAVVFVEDSVDWPEYVSAQQAGTSLRFDASGKAKRFASE
jgi:hypothetical protein